MILEVLELELRKAEHWSTTKVTATLADKFFDQPKQESLPTKYTIRCNVIKFTEFQVSNIGTSTLTTPPMSH